MKLKNRVFIIFILYHSIFLLPLPSSSAFSPVSDMTVMTALEETATHFLLFDAAVRARDGEIIISISEAPPEDTIIKSVLELAYKMRQISDFERLIILAKLSDGQVRRTVLEMDDFEKLLAGKITEEEFIRTLLSEDAGHDLYEDPLSAIGLRDARKKLLTGNISEASKILDTLLAGENVSAHAYLLRGYCHYLSGNLQTALTFYEEAEKRGIEPYLISPYLGVLYLETGQPEKAATILEKALEKEKKDPDLFYNYALALYELQRDEEAAVAIEEAIARRPGQPDYLITAGEILLRAGKARRARELLERAKETGAPEPETSYRLALAQIALNEKEGLEVLAGITRENPDFYPAVLSLYETYIKNNRPDLAKKLLEKLDPLSLERSSFKEEANELKRLLRETVSK